MGAIKTHCCLTAIRWSTSRGSEGPHSRPHQPGTPESHICHHKGQWLVSTSFISAMLRLLQPQPCCWAPFSRITCRRSAPLNMAYRWLWTSWESAVSRTVYLAYFFFIKATVVWNLLCPQRAASSYSDVHGCMLHRQGMLMLAGTLMF